MNSIEWRNCQFCKQGAQVYRDGVYNLVKYGIRHYAHPACLAARKGREGGKALIPEHQHESYDVGLCDADDWQLSKADLIDERARAKSQRTKAEADASRYDRPVKIF